MDERNAKNICLFGPQGSGKGTQAGHIIEHFGIPHVSTGNIFRAAITEHTELGMQAKGYMDKGDLVPDELTDGLVRERLLQEDAIDGFVLDGYPRNPAQSDQLDTMTTLSYVIVIDITDDESIRRISRRRVCSSCAATYHLDFKPTKQLNVCDDCGGHLVQRDDDKPDAIDRRLRTYHKQTEPIFERYEERGLLHRIDGMQSIDAVWNDIRAIFEGK